MFKIEANKLTFFIGNIQKLYKGHIIRCPKGYFISCIIESINGVPYFRFNDALLVDSGFNTKSKQKSLYENVLGYWEDDDYSEGNWPLCKTEEDLFRILYAINEKIKDTEFVDISFII